MGAYTWDIIQTLFMIILGLVGYSAKTEKTALTNRINKIEKAVEDRPTCHYADTDRRIVKVEKRQNRLDEFMIDIKTSLAGIKKDLEWIKKKGN